MKKIEKQEQDADAFLDEIRIRESSEEGRIMSQMVASISTEIDTLSRADRYDPRLPILCNMREGLQADLDAYLQLKTDRNTFVVQSLQTIKEQ